MDLTRNRILTLLFVLSLLVPGATAWGQITPTPASAVAKPHKGDHHERKGHKEHKDHGKHKGQHHAKGHHQKGKDHKDKDHKNKDHKGKDKGPKLFSAALTPADGPIVSRYGGNASPMGAGLSRYNPRQFAINFQAADSTLGAPWKVTNAGAFNGWDVFPFTEGNRIEVSNTWATFTLDRPAKLGYVWRYDPSKLGANPAPAWLAANGWTQQGTIDATLLDPNRPGWTGPWPVYTKEFAAGTVAIPSPSQNGAAKNLPWVLFAETGGTPSAAPSVPAGKTLPAPNQECPVWVHDQYKTGGFPTWHDSHDPKYWCYFNHDHGSNPRLVCGNDAGCLGEVKFGQVASLANMTENHWGHKLYALDYTATQGVKVLVIQHQGTWGLARINTCVQQFHMVRVIIKSTAGDTLYNVQFMADYGRSLATLGQDQGGDPYPGVCNEATGYTTTTPSRQVPFGSFCNPANPASFPYEPWNFAVNRYLASLGLGGNFVVNTQDILTCPLDAAGTQAYEATNRSGTARFFTANQMAFNCPPQANAQGYWWTDPMGLNVVTSTTPNAVRQFCKPGWAGFASMVAGEPANCHRGGPDMARWGDWATCVPSGQPGDFENSITSAHGPN